MAVTPEATPMTAVARPFEAGFVPLWQAVDSLFKNAFAAPSLFGGVRPYTWQAWTNLYETDEAYVAQFAMPGIKPDSLECTIEQGVLTCKGESALAAPAEGKAIWQSFGGDAYYQIALPGEVEASQAQASYEGGVLTITVPKAAHARSQKIPLIASSAKS